MSIVVANIPITIYEGGTFDKSFIWKTGSPSAAVDLTGYTANMMVRAKLADTTPLLSVPLGVIPWVADAATGIYIPTQTGDDIGKYRIYLKDNETVGMCAAHKDIAGVYDLFLYSAAGEAVLKQYGVATIVAAVTR
jgi:hypothetical protein